MTRRPLISTWSAMVLAGALFVFIWWILSLFPNDLIERIVRAYGFN
jgi:hypothetical protein